MHSSPPSLFLMMTSQITQKEKAGLDAAVAFPRRSWFTASCQKDQSSISAQTLSLSRKLLKICQKRHITSCSDKLREANSSAKKPKDLRLKLNNNYHGGRNRPVQLKGSVGCRMIDSLTVRVMDKTIIQSIKSGKPPADVQKQPQFQTFHCRRRNLGQDFHFCWSLAESSHPHATKAFILRVHQKAADSAHSHADLRFLRLNYSRLHQPRHKALSTALNSTRALWKTDSHAVLAPNSTQTSDLL